MFDFGGARKRRRPDLTPMIDVVFLLLVFFMLASRFSVETSLPLSAARGGAAQDWVGRFRLIDIAPQGVLLNGRAVADDDLVDAVGALMDTPDAPILLRGKGARLNDLTRVMVRLRAAGFQRLILVE